MQEPLIYVGAKPDTINAARDGIIKIMEARADQETIRHALSMFKETVSVRNISISGCHLDGSTVNNLKVQAVENES